MNQMTDKNGNDIPNDWPVWYQWGRNPEDVSYFIVEFDMTGVEVLTWPNGDGNDMAGPISDTWAEGVDSERARIFSQKEFDALVLENKMKQYLVEQ